MRLADHTCHGYWLIDSIGRLYSVAAIYFGRAMCVRHCEYVSLVVATYHNVGMPRAYCGSAGGCTIALVTRCVTFYSAFSVYLPILSSSHLIY